MLAGRISIATIDGRTGTSRPSGGFGWWVGDEGVKLSAWSPESELAVPGVSPQLAVTLAASLNLKNSLASWAARLPQVLSYEQLRVLPAPGSPLADSTLQDNFHHVTLTSLQLQPAGVGVVARSGMVNLNTTSQPVWNGLATTYNTFATGAKISNPATMANRMRDNFPGAIAAGKAANAPFLSVAALGGSELLANALAGLGVMPEEFMAAVGPVLATRSDTFRLRAYGDAVNPADASKTEAAAWCEAIVQRIPEEMDAPFGRRFVIIYFRWLGPEDI